MSKNTTWAPKRKRACLLNSGPFGLELLVEVEPFAFRCVKVFSNHKGFYLWLAANLERLQKKLQPLVKIPASETLSGEVGFVPALMALPLTKKDLKFSPEEVVCQKTQAVGTSRALLSIVNKEDFLLFGAMNFAFARGFTEGVNRRIESEKRMSSDN